MDTFHNRRLRIILPDIFHQTAPGQLGTLIRFGKQEHIRPIQVAQGFTQNTPGQQIPVAKQVQRIHQHDVQIPVQLPVLVTIVHDDNFGIQFFYRITAGHVTVLTDDYGHVRHHLGHQVGFVTGLVAGHENFLSV